MDRFQIPETPVILGKTVTVTVDRPLGSRHPKHPAMRYPFNYGYIKGVQATDGEEIARQVDFQERWFDTEIRWKARKSVFKKPIRTP